MMAFLIRHKWRATAFMTTLALSLVFSIAFSHPASAATISAKITQVSSDPYTNSTSQHRTEVEPDTYSYGSTVVSAFQVGRFYDGGSSNIGWATTKNAGRSWTHGFLPGTTVYATPAGTYDRISDPAVAYDAAHKTWLISSLAVLEESGSAVGAAVLVNRSTDGGVTWDNPVAVRVATPTDFFDKEWIVCDDSATSPYYGHCYVEWDNAALNGLVLMSTSTDGGLTWGTPGSPANATTFFGIGGQPLVQPNGTVVVPIEGFNLTTGATSILSFTSTNGGASWNAAVTISQIIAYTPPASLRSAVGFHTAEVDRSGRVYVVWPDCRFETGCSTDDFVLSTSTDGVTWSAVQRIPIDSVGSHVDELIPGLAVDKSTGGSNAHLALTFYYFTNANCFTYNCQLNVGFVSSTNSGASWSSKQHLAGPMLLPWLADTNQGFMVGDYISTSIVGDDAFSVFAVATPPSGGYLNESMYAPVDADLRVTGGSITSHGDSVVVAPSTASHAHPTGPFLRTAN